MKIDTTREKTVEDWFKWVSIFKSTWLEVHVMRHALSPTAVYGKSEPTYDCFEFEEDGEEL